MFTLGFPCTGTSIAGNGTGLKHPESSLWLEALRCITIGQTT
ncbi:DNA cytosine methyltransferase [Pelatocladus sp. BLCC-F211]